MTNYTSLQENLINPVPLIVQYNSSLTALTRWLFFFSARAENENSDDDDDGDDDDADFDNEALASDEDEIDEEGQQYIEKLEKSVSNVKLSQTDFRYLVCSFQWFNFLCFLHGKQVKKDWYFDEYINFAICWYPVWCIV